MEGDRSSFATNGAAHLDRVSFGRRRASNLASLYFRSCACAASLSSSQHETIHVETQAYSNSPVPPYSLLSDVITIKHLRKASSWTGMLHCIAFQLSYDPYLRGLPRLNAAEQRELNSRMEKKQMKEFMTVLKTQYQFPNTIQWDLPFREPNAETYRRCTRDWSSDASTIVLMISLRNH